MFTNKKGITKVENNSSWNKISIVTKNSLYNLKANEKLIILIIIIIIMK
jgi:hypothetical protein